MLMKRKRVISLVISEKNHRKSEGKARENIYEC